jgi:hypothetical protein
MEQTLGISAVMNGKDNTKNTDYNFSRDGNSVKEFLS